MHLHFLMLFSLLIAAQAFTVSTLTPIQTNAHSLRPRMTTTASQRGTLASALEATVPANNDNKAGKTDKKPRVRLIILHGWIAIISTFLIKNYYCGPWPGCLLGPSRKVWVLVHAMSSMLFGGTIILSTLIEWLVARSKIPAVVKFWFLTVPSLDAAVVLPALTGSMVSGAAQAAIDYGMLASAPKHVIGTLHALVTFGIWWVLTDVTTQRAARGAVLKWCKEVEDGTGSSDSEVPKVIKVRRLSNIISCLFVSAVYAIMVLKPGAKI